MQPIQLAIPKPCHESWDNMLPVDKGRFCNACAKQVVDFSTMSDQQVLNYLKAKKNESVCGRVYPDQLNRNIEPLQPLRQKKWYWKFFTLCLLFFSKSSASDAQTTPTVQHQPVKALQGDTIMIQGEIAPEVKKHAISGKVLDARGLPVANASIIVNESGRIYKSGKDGGFVFLVSDAEKKLRISAPGFSEKIIVLNNKTNYTIALVKKVHPDPIIMGKMIIRPLSPKTN